MKKYLLVTGSLIFFVSAFAQINDKIILTKTEKDVIPEGITIDPVKGNIYVSSIAHKKFISIDASGMHKDFITTNHDGFLEGLGMNIDAKKNWLGAVSNGKQENWFISKIHAFDLT